MKESEGHAYRREHQLSGTARKLDIHREAVSQLDLARASSNGRAAVTLVKEGPLRLTLLTLKEGTIVADHKAPGPLSIHLIAGEVDISVGDVTERLTPGQGLVLDANVTHAVAATQDSAILLTFAVA